MGISSGYVTMFGSDTIVNGTSRGATTYTDNGQVAKPRIIVLPGGVKVDYDGTSASPTSPGQVTQEFFDTDGATFLDTMHGKIGTSASLTLRKAETAVGPESATARLIMVKDTTPVQGSRTRVWGSMTWEIVGVWS